MYNMKNILSICLFLALAVSPMAQRKVQLPHIKEANPADNIAIPQGLSASSAFLLTDIMVGERSVAELVDRYGMVYIDGEPTVLAFVEGPQEALEAMGVQFSSHAGKGYSARIPLSVYAKVAQSGLCSWIDVGSKVYTRLENARADMGIDDIYMGVGLPQGYDGTGVVVGIIDDGFEYGNPAFYNHDGSELRVKRVWKQSARTGTSPEGFSYGSEYTTPEDILTAGTDDRGETHGTHVAGIAAGQGSTIDAGRKYRGMAPGADIVLVSYAENETSIYDGITYIRKYAASQNKPCVINMSLGTHTGPHDGTSSFDRMCDAFLEARPDSILLVGAAGNEGSDNLHLGLELSAGDTVATLVTFDPYYNGYGLVDLWGSPNMPYKVAVGVLNYNTGQMVATSDFFSSATAFSNQGRLNNGKIQYDIVGTGTNPYNGRQNISMTLLNTNTQSNNYAACLIFTADTTTYVHGWGTVCSFTADVFANFVSGDNDYSVGEIGGSGNSMISVGAYTTASSWTSYNGHVLDFPEDVVGNLASFSSHGPTLDGRTKPEICAPGQQIIAPISRFATTYTRSDYCTGYDEVDGTKEYYGAFQGTSMSSPMVTGILALWLQHTPWLCHDSAIALLQMNPRTDSFTDSIPAGGSNLWGWGKINPLTGLITNVNPSGIEEAVSSEEGGVMSLDGRRIMVSLEDGSAYSIVDMMGRTLVRHAAATPATYTMPAAGIYLVCPDNAPARKVVVR